MSNQFQCITCGGTYFDHCPDGMIYHHVCGPLELKPDFHAVERPDARDENIDVSRGGVLQGIVSEGQGVKCLTSDVLQEPPWITRLKGNVPQDEDGR